MSEILIGFTDDLISQKENEEPLEKQLEKIEEGKKHIFIPEKYKLRLLESFKCVAVHDFGDNYHKSEEELNEDEVLKVFRKLSQRKKFRKLPDYIREYRKIIEAINTVAKNNGVMDTDEFLELFWSGDITINGILFPKYAGSEKNRIDYDYLCEYIAGDEDPDDFLSSIRDEDHVTTMKELDNMIVRLYGNESESIIQSMDEHNEQILESEEYEIDLEYNDDNPQTDIAVSIEKDDFNKIKKKLPGLNNASKRMLKRRNSDFRASTFAHNFISEDIEEIEEYDKKQMFKTLSTIPQFDGNVTDGKAYRKYLYELQEWEDEYLLYNYHGKSYSRNKIQEIETKKFLEENDWNIKELFGNKEEERELRKLRKREKAREKKLKEKLLAIQNRQKLHRNKNLLDEVDQSIGKKKKKKKGKKEKSTKDLVKKNVKKMKKNTDDFFTAVTGNDGKFSDYENKTKDWSWDSILEEYNDKKG